MVDKTVNKRYQKFLSKPENCAKVSASRAIHRVIKKREVLTSDKEALLKLYPEIKRSFLKSLKGGEISKFKYVRG